MRNYVPDDEARALAEANARNRSIEPTGRGHNDYLKMRAAERAAEDPLGLDDEPDPWVEELARLRAMVGWGPVSKPVDPLSVRMSKDRTVTLDEEPEEESDGNQFRVFWEAWAAPTTAPTTATVTRGGVTYAFDPIVHVVSIDGWDSHHGSFHLVHGSRGSTDNLQPMPDASVNRKRHGAASVCPRHGPTRGGLCRKCQR